MARNRIRWILAVGAMATTAGPVHGQEVSIDPLDQWPHWRGPLDNGVAPHGDPPIHWSETSNIRWKTATPGKGHSTPIVWDDRIILTTAIPFGEAVDIHGHESHGAHDNETRIREHKFAVLAIDRHTGSIDWSRTVRKERPHESTHVTGSWASASPATDGEVLVASFGSRGIYGLDLDGGLLWERDLGDMRIKHGHGEGNSPALAGDRVVVNWDHEGESSLFALNKYTGSIEWRAPREETTSWSSPLVVEHDGRTQVIVAATRRIRAYDLDAGRLIWECGGMSDNVVATPVAGGGMLYVGSSYEKRVMMGIRLEGAAGDITGSPAVVWTHDRFTPYVPSPLLYGDELYFLKHYQGYLTAVNGPTGEVIYGPQRLPHIDNVYASPVGAANRVYIVERSGSTLVIQRGAPYKELASNPLDDSFSASPAIVGNELFLRGEAFLYCIARAP